MPLKVSSQSEKLTNIQIAMLTANDRFRGNSIQIYTIEKGPGAPCVVCPNRVMVGDPSIIFKDAAKVTRYIHATHFEDFSGTKGSYTSTIPGAMKDDFRSSVELWGKIQRDLTAGPPRLGTSFPEVIRVFIEGFNTPMHAKQVAKLVGGGATQSQVETIIRTGGIGASKRPPVVQFQNLLVFEGNATWTFRPSLGDGHLSEAIGGLKTVTEEAPKPPSEVQRRKMIWVKVVGHLTRNPGRWFSIEQISEQLEETEERVERFLAHGLQQLESSPIIDDFKARLEKKIGPAGTMYGYFIGAFEEEPEPTPKPKPEPEEAQPEPNGLRGKIFTGVGYMKDGTMLLVDANDKLLEANYI
jgi:hypothetical protein